MKYIVEVPHLYSRECNDNRVLCLGKNHQGICCDSFQQFIKSSYVHLLRHRLRNIADLFQLSLEITYNSHLVESDAFDIFKLEKNIIPRIWVAREIC